jgi:hypothetical protein
MALQVRDQAVHMNGFTGLNRALQRIDGGRANFGLEYELQRRLRTVGETVAKAAPQYVTHNTGPGTGVLEGSVKVSVTTKTASVYSNSVYGGAQEYGAGPKAGWAAQGPHIQRANASKWMTKAVESQKAFVAVEMDSLLDWVVEEFNRG